MMVEEVQGPVTGTAPKKATALGQACCRSVGGGVWLRLVESHTALSAVDQEPRRCICGKIMNSS